MKENASKHKTMSYGGMCEAEKELEEKVNKFLPQAQRIDEEEDKLYPADRRGDELPEELPRRETRLEKIGEAKAALEAQARRKAEECPNEAGADREDLASPKEERKTTPNVEGKA